MSVSQIFLCIGTLTLAGVISSVGVRMYWNLTKTNNPNPELMLALIKIALVLFMFPIPFMVVGISYFQYANSGWIMTGDFLYGTTKNINIVFVCIGVVWVIGSLIRLIEIFYLYFKLRVMIKGNVPVDNKRCIELFEEFKSSKGLKNVSVCQNDLLCSPVVVGIFSPMIILPYQSYGEQELRIIFEHEFNHLKYRDLIWKLMGIVVTAVHWFNPFSYIMFDDLMFFQEVVCDCNSTRDNIFYSCSDYITLLTRMDQNQHINVHMTAIGESRHRLIRRIEIMVESRRVKEVSKWMMKVCCLALIMSAVLPTGIVTAYAAELHNKWIWSTEERVVESLDVAGSDLEIVRANAGNVEEVFVSSPIHALATTVTLDFTLAPNQRALYGYKKMYAGDQVSVMANCDDANLTYRIGIKLSTGIIWYVEGTGTLIKTFTIEEDGMYSVYVQNMNSSSLTVTGAALYP